MRIIFLLLGATLLFTTACEDLDQSPPNFASSNSLTDFSGVLNGAYFYQHGSVTPMAVMGDFRADNALMLEPPYTEFDAFTPNLTAMENDFFGPFYTALYKSILSANTVIAGSQDDTEVGEAKFLRALSYFKLVRVFGEVPINLSAAPEADDDELLRRRPVDEVYTVITDDLNDAIAVLDDNVGDGRASRLAARALLGMAQAQRGDYSSAVGTLQQVIDDAPGAGVMLVDDYADLFGVENDLNSEVIYATQISSSITDEYGFSEFWSWYGGLDTKSLMPLDPDLVAAFDDSPGDLRRDVNIDTSIMASPKYPQTGGPDHDWIEIRLGDILLLYAEALNATGGDEDDVLDVLDPIRARAGLDALDGDDFDDRDEVAQAILDERRLELAFEGKRWFDLVRTGTVSEEMGVNVNEDYFIFPIPTSEVLVSDVITQNDGY